MPGGEGGQDRQPPGAEFSGPWRLFVRREGRAFREIVTRDNLNTQSRWLYYGQEVSPEAISADRGRSLTDEELEGNINVLECDNLFWFSVFWRMGVGRMSIFLDGEDEFAKREIALDSINTYKKPEVLLNEISLEEFARLKRFVLDESLEAGGRYLCHADGRCLHAGEVLEGEEGIFQISEGYGEVRGHACRQGLYGQ